MANEDFSDDTKDAGDMGAGHSVTALYEIEPAPARAAGALLALRVRYKQPGATDSKLLTFQAAAARPFGQASGDFRFAAAVAGFGLMLRDSRFRGDVTYTMVAKLAAEASAPDPGGYRQELQRMVAAADRISGGSVAAMPTVR